jgi:hypothetical protein
MKRSTWLSVFAAVAFTPLFHAQCESLRIINLMPISAKPVDLYQGTQPYVTGMRPGYYQNYGSLPSGANHFSLQQGGVVIGDFDLPASSGGFFTVAIYQDVGSSPKIAFYPDELKQDEAKPGEPPPPPKKRLRLYLGGYDFPVKVSVASRGEWMVKGKAQFIDVDILGTPPEVVFVEYKDRYEQVIKVAYPTYLSLGDSSSFFVSQRGVKRVTLNSGLDNQKVEVAEETEAPPTPPAP